MTNRNGRSSSYRDALDLLKRHSSFILTGHVKPDGDAIGSELALASLLRRMGKRAVIVNADPVPARYRFLPGTERIRAMKKVTGSYDVAVFLECSSPERAGGILDLARQVKAVLNVDSHVRSGTYGTVNVIDPTISSTCEQVYELIRLAGKNLTGGEALVLYAGLITDTGRFQYSNTSAATHQFAARLLERGVSPPEVYRRIFEEKPVAAVRLLGRVLDTLVLREGGRVAMVEAHGSMFRSTGARPEDTEEIIDQVRAIRGVSVAAFLRAGERGADGKVKVSLRSNGVVDVNRVAAEFGGGGHRNASGCSLTGPLPAARAKLLTAIRKALR